jgi:hypothetical protein
MSRTPYQLVVVPTADMLMHMIFSQPVSIAESKSIGTDYICRYCGKAHVGVILSIHPEIHSISVYNACGDNQV